MATDIDRLLLDSIADGLFPSAVYAVGERGRTVLEGAVGYAVLEPEPLPARPDTIYDLASLTKPLVTALLLAQLVQSGDVSTDDPLSAHLECEMHGSLTIGHLAAHSSGLPAWRPFYALVARPDEIIAAICRTGRAAPGAVIYSDLNYLLLQAVVEARCGLPLDKAASERIFKPLGLQHTLFNPPASLRPRIAASEHGNEFERELCRESGIELKAGSLRSEAIWGQVHDGNAWFMGGVAGHAGLFGTAGDVLRLAHQFLPAHATSLDPETCRLFLTNFTPGQAEERSFGFQLASTTGSTAGQLMPETSFGHTGFAGTSLWIDPEHERVFVLLTNRTHGQSPPFKNINSVRRRFHATAIQAL